MILIDVNLLLYAYAAETPEHATAAAWLEETLAGPETVGIPLPVIWAFLRVGTNPRILPTPIPAAEAFGVIRDLCALPQVILVEPGLRHLDILERLATEAKATGPLLSDAVLAAIAIENGATLASTDRDFARFEGLRWINPLAAPGR